MGTIVLRDAVAWTWPDAEQRLASLDLRLETRPQRYRVAECESRGTPYRIEACGWIDRAFTLNVKYCRVQSPKVDVATVMVYPIACPERLPVFGAEWVVVGDRGHLMVLDVHPAGEQPALQAELAPVFGPLGRRWQPQIEAVEAPAWFASIAQPWALLFSCDSEWLALVRSAYREYLGTAVERWYRPLHGTLRAGVEAAAVAEYKWHHFHHSPGRRLLTGAFGAEYVENFLAWHFGPPNQALALEARETRQAG